MTDIVLNAGSGGATLGTETITGVDYQLIKMLDGTAGSTSPTGVAANPFQVSLANTAANAVAVKVDGSAVTQPVSGTVTANLGTLNGVALDTSVNGVIVAQGSTTSGEKGPLVQGAVTTSAPSYTTAQTSPLSLTTSGALRVDGSAVTQPVSGTFWQATQPVSAASLPLPSGASTAAKQPALGTAGAASSDVITVQGIASMTALKVDGSGVTQPVSGTFWQTTQPASQSGTWTVQPGNTANTTPWLVQQNGVTAGGSTPYKLNSAASTNATSVKGSAGQVYMITASNVGSGVAFLKLYNKASAPTVGTDTPILVFLIPVASTAANGAGTNIPVPSCGLAFGTGIAFAITGGAADSDTTAVGANQVIVNIGYV